MDNRTIKSGCKHSDALKVITALICLQERQNIDSFQQKVIAVEHYGQKTVEILIVSVHLSSVVDVASSTRHAMFNLRYNFLTIIIRSPYFI
jgi:hypothetical protein